MTNTEKAQKTYKILHKEEDMHKMHRKSRADDDDYLWRGENVVNVWLRELMQDVVG